MSQCATQMVTWMSRPKEIQDVFDHVKDLREEAQSMGFKELKDDLDGLLNISPMPKEVNITCAIYQQELDIRMKLLVLDMI